MLFVNLFKSKSKILGSVFHPRDFRVININKNFHRIIPMKSGRLSQILPFTSLTILLLLLVRKELEISRPLIF